MAQCKAITSNGEQCKREARDGLEYCAIPAHAEQEKVEIATVAYEAEKKQYDIVLVALAGADDIAMNMYSRDSLVKIVQGRYDNNYEIAYTETFGRIPAEGEVREHFWVMFVFKLRE